MKKIIILYVEGETDEEFYNRLKDYLRDKSINNYIIKVVCVKSNTKFSNKLLNKFKKEIVCKYPREEKIVYLCYDGDVFEFGKHPPFDAKKIENELIAAGATKVFSIVAKRTIEDYIMIDEEGVKKFLKLPNDIKAKGKNGLKKIEYLYSKANKTYIKGNKTSGLINSLDMEKICNKICFNISILCDEIGIKCEKCSICNERK